MSSSGNEKAVKSQIKVQGKKQEQMTVSEAQKQEMLKEMYNKMKRQERMKQSPKNKKINSQMQDPFIYEAQYDDSIDPYLPKVLIMLSDNVQLIRFNSVPLLHAQIEILQNPMDYDSELQKLGLNDVVYLVPEFTPS